MKHTESTLSNCSPPIKKWIRFHCTVGLFFCLLHIINTLNHDIVPETSKGLPTAAFKRKIRILKKSHPKSKLLILCHI